jgi:hypothetical protein
MEECIPTTRSKLWRRRDYGSDLIEVCATRERHRNDSHHRASTKNPVY